MKKFLCLILSLILVLTVLSSCKVEKKEVKKVGITEKVEQTKAEDNTSVKTDKNESSSKADIKKPKDDPSVPDGIGSIKPMKNIKSRTILVYIVGSNLESQYAAATNDLIEMQDSGVDTDKNNIVIYAGGSNLWQNNLISADNNTVLSIENGYFNTEKSYPVKNMGESETLTEFIKYGLENFKSDSYSLILWDHGSGPIEGYGNDEISGDVLTLSEIGQALKDSGLGVNRKLELIGFDACLMSSVETAWMLRNYAEYFVASQEIEPGNGWDYSFLSELGNCKNGAELGTAIIDYYYDSTYLNYGNSADITLACMDLSEVENVEKKINSLFKKAYNGDFAELSQMVVDSKFFYPDAYLDLVDINSLATNMKSSYKKQAEALIKSVSDFVVYNRTNVDRANGVSLYHPYYNEYYLTEYLEVYDSWGFASDYYDYIDHFAEQLGGTGYFDWLEFFGMGAEEDVDEDEREFSVELTDRQAKNYASSKYYIVKKTAKDEYIFIFSGNDAELDENNILSADYKGKAIYGVNDKTGELSEVPLAMYQFDDTYYFPAIFCDTETFEMTNAQWRMSFEDGEPVLRTAYPLTDDMKGSAPKQYLDPEDYDYIQIAVMSKKLTKDEEGNPLPYTEWKETDNVYFHEYSVEDGFSLTQEDVDYEGDYYVFFEVTDVYGDTYTSKLTKLK
ncbi:MAG: hypothetical protein E7652_04795 [Ruminococcaceae bacterium]|nr:hypothetical protein [Oscillospiraceae bacterium]